MKQPSLKDVATHAGVSFQTASKVLKGKGTVAEETRERVIRVADELGYVPNVVARSLVTQNTRTVGILVGDLSDHIVARFVVGAEREARRRGHAVLIGSLDPGGSDDETPLQALLERRVDGIVMAAPQLEEDDRLGELLRGHVPAVSIHHVPGGGVTLVGSDQFQTGYLATGHLLSLGHRRIGSVTGLESRRVTQSRLRGYREALERAGVAFDPMLLEEGDWEAEGGYQATKRLLERSPDISAIFAHNDLMAIGVLSALHEKGLEVPKDCAVIGCDDIPVAAHTIPPLTTVRIPFYETGETAVRMLLDTIVGELQEPQIALLPVSLVHRTSCGCGGGEK